MRDPGKVELRRSIAARTPAVRGISMAIPFEPDPARVEDVGWWKILVGSADTISSSCVVIN